MTTGDGFERLRVAGLIAVVRADRREDAVRVVGALLAGGVQAVELTFTTPGAAEALAQVRQVYGGEVLLGAGTIREIAQVEAALHAGVDFMVTSHFRADVLDAMLSTGLPVMPGVFTPSEVGQALDAGARAVKLFPASTAGPGHLRALRGPFPGLQVVPTGGIDLPDIHPWFAAGALAVGAGSELVPRAAVQTGRWDEVSRRAERFVDELRAARTKLEPSRA
ncbi:MAG TPA: 2-dehydro-3-deoxyphosphogluconate aldolase [Chloroflexi bacterium]|jgi:2-dehydro-3-deoxyphosphogluconate aldolase/(4S)-4-hydroxy-2-oxoglutarate aldolase|nr:2-dehydro-3-deoxyphosphogluconate aldolase [Chloroflexota bacterium]